MKYFIAILTLFILNVFAFGQNPQVPSVIQFADMQLKLNDQLRREIQVDVDALHRSPKYFDMKLERAKMYFPIIEKILKEENVPDDFKYLVIQESALISDAVSSANAVGFWQFKIASAQEVGLRVDKYVDERMNIAASTHGASKYFKKHNFYFDNWLYALVAHYSGLGGANSIVNEKYFGVKKMSLNRKTHWYVKKYLAHKVAFEAVLNENGTSSNRLYEFTEGGGKSLDQIARNFNVDQESLRDYNKWLKRGRVPEDRIYSVTVPGLTTPPQQQQIVRINNPDIQKSIDFFSPNSALYPKIKINNKEDTRLVKVNGLPGIISNEGDDVKSLAILGGLDLSKFLKINEIDITHVVEPGQAYYFKKKKGKAKEYFHTLMPGEDLWTVSQRYGVTKQKLLGKNRLKKSDKINPGLVIWIRNIRPAEHPPEYVELPTAVVQETLIVDESQTGELNNKEEKEVVVLAPVIIEDPDYEDIIEEAENQEDAFYEPENDEINAASGTSDASQNIPEELQAELNNEENNSMDIHPLFHLVAAGETLYAISRKYNVSVTDLLEINDLSIDESIKIGQKIYLKDPFAEEKLREANKEIKKTETFITYIVKKGDTMYSISRKYKVEVDDILSWNNKDQYNLIVGEQLKILVKQ